MNPLCLEEGVGLIPWSPLAGGVLAGNREAGTVRSQSAMGRGRYNRPEDQAVLDALKSVAAARGEAPAQVAIAWMLSKPAVTAPIIGVTKAAPDGRSAEGGGKPAQRRGDRDPGGALRAAGGDRRADTRPTWPAREIQPSRRGGRRRSAAHPFQLSTIALERRAAPAPAAVSALVPRWT